MVFLLVLVLKRGMGGALQEQQQGGTRVEAGREGGLVLCKGVKRELEVL